MLKKSMVIMLLLLTTEGVYGEPIITSIEGTPAHNSIVMVRGAGFGNKNPAAPLLWDDGSSNPALGTRYDAWLPTNAEQGSYYNMAYRTTPFRGVESPNNRIRYMLAGAHATSLESGQAYAGGNVALGKNITSHTYFINYYYRVDPYFDEENHPTLSDNMKELVLSNTAGQFYPDTPYSFGYANWCNSDIPDVNYVGPIKLGRMPIDPANQSSPYGCSGNNLVQHSNPINRWTKMQWEGFYNIVFDSPQISLTTYPDGQRTYQSHYGDGITVTEYARGTWIGYPKANDLRFIGIGGFARIPRMNSGNNSFRYFAGIYIDNTHARVMLGDNRDYNSCTIMEPQIPIAWGSDTVQMRLNLGALPDNGTAYIFIFDASNMRNLQGFPITTRATTTSDTMPPGPPARLR